MFKLADRLIYRWWWYILDFALNKSNSHSEIVYPCKALRYSLPQCMCQPSEMVHECVYITWVHHMEVPFPSDKETSNQDMKNGLRAGS